MCVGGLTAGQLPCRQGGCGEQALTAAASALVLSTPDHKLTREAVLPNRRQLQDAKGPSTVSGNEPSSGQTEGMLVRLSGICSLTLFKGQSMQCFSFVFGVSHHTSSISYF